MGLSRCYIRDADLEVRPDLGCLRRRTGEEIYLRPKTFQTLLFLLEHRDRIVAKDEIIDRIWRDTAVTDDTLVQCIVEIRKALGDDAKQARFVRTLPKSGYRFVGDVDVDVPVDQAPAVPMSTPSPSPTPHVSPVLPTIAPPSSRRTRPGSRMWLPAAALLVAVVLLAGYLKSSDSNIPVNLSEALGAAESQKSRVAVLFLDNESQTPDLDWLREGLADMVVTGLSRSQGVSVIGRQQVELLLDRVNHPKSAPIDLATAINVAKRGHVDYMVGGGFAKLGNTIRVDLRVHDQGGRLVATEALTIESPDELLKQVDVLSWRIARHFGEPSQVAPAQSVTLTNNLEAYRFYSLGVTQANHYHNVDAIDLLTKASRLDPEFAMAYGRIGYAYGVTGSQVEQARPFLAKAYALSHRLSERDRLQVEAWNALVHFDYASAASTFAAIIRRYPLEVEPYVRLGLLQAGERQYEESIRTFQRGLAIDPESTDLWNRLGGVYAEADRHADSIAAREKYVALQPKEANAYDSLGSSLDIAGRYSEAEAAFQHALDLNPKFEVVWVHLGNTYMHTGQYAKAETAYRRYGDVAPTDYERRRAQTALAVLAHRRGKPAAAASLMAAGRPVLPLGLDVPIRIDAGESLDQVSASIRAPLDAPNRGSRIGDRVLRHAQGTIALKRGFVDNAIAEFKNALAERAVLWQADWLEDCLANAYLQLGRYDEAIAEYRRVLQTYPQYPLAQYRLAQAFEGKGQRDLAQRAYQDFLKNWPNADADIKEVVSAKAKIAAR